jgi:hypothetical protein
MLIPIVKHSRLNKSVELDTPESFIIEQYTTSMSSAVLVDAVKAISLMISFFIVIYRLYN